LSGQPDRKKFPFGAFWSVFVSWTLFGFYITFSDPLKKKMEKNGAPKPLPRKDLRPNEVPEPSFFVTTPPFNSGGGE
jgi:hypothetical protein